MEQVKALFPVCNHIKNNGIRCNSPALRGMNFCYNHIGGKPMAFVRAKTTTTYDTNLNLVHPGTREAIQHNLAVIAEALNRGKLDSQTANSYIRIYRLAENNLTRWEKIHNDNPDKELLPLNDEIIRTSEAPSEPGTQPIANSALESPSLADPEPPSTISPANLAHNIALAVRQQVLLGRPLNDFELEYFGVARSVLNESAANAISAGGSDPQRPTVLPLV